MNIERTANNIENLLTEVSVYPVVGTLAGGAKVVMGAVQTISAIAFSILAFIPTLIKGDRSVYEHAWTHIKHGLGNIVAGTLEAIPIVQQILYLARVIKNNVAYMGEEVTGANLYIRTKHENKFMPYTSLVVNDLTFDGTQKAAIDYATQRYQNKLSQCNNSCSSQIKLNFAKETRNKALKSSWQVDQQGTFLQRIKKTA